MSMVFGAVGAISIVVGIILSVRNGDGGDLQLGNGLIALAAVSLGSWILAMMLGSLSW